MSAKKSKLEVEGEPPADAGGMVSEEMLVGRIKELNKNENDDKIPSDKVLSLFMAEKLYDISQSLKELLEIFKGAKPTSEPVVAVSETKKEVPPSVPEAPSTPTEAVTTKPTSSRVNEIVAAFKPVSDSVTVDTESSTQYVLVRPKGYLGTAKFAEVGKIARSLDAVYVKQGKESHFKIPKMTGEKQDTTQKPVEVAQEKSTGTVRDLFPENLAKLLNFTDQDNIVIISPVKFLGAENFAKVASIVRDNNGKYVSAGKESHFELLRK